MFFSVFNLNYIEAKAVDPRPRIDRFLQVAKDIVGEDEARALADLLKAKKYIKARDVEMVLGVSRPTARKYLKMIASKLGCLERLRVSNKRYSWYMLWLHYI